MNDTELAYAVAKLYRKSDGWTMGEIRDRLVRESGRSGDIILMMVHAIDAYVDNGE